MWSISLALISRDRSVLNIIQRVKFKKRSISPILTSKYHISDYFPLRNKSYMDFSSCVALGKLLEYAESVFPLQNGENDSTFFMGILHSALHLVRIEQVLTFAHFFLFALSSPNFSQASLFPAVPLHSTNPQARTEDLIPLISFSWESGDQSQILLQSDPTGLSPCLPRLPSKDSAFPFTL